MEEVIKRVNGLIKRLGLTPNSFAKEVGLGSSNLSRKLKGTTPFTAKDFAKISEALGISREWLENGNGDEPSIDAMCLKRPSYQVEIDHKVITDAIEKSINDAINNPNSAFSIVANVLGNHNSQNVMSGSDRVKERKEASMAEKNAQLIQIINAKDEIIKSKDNEIKLLRKLLADNGIEV